MAWTNSFGSRVYPFFHIRPVVSDAAHVWVLVEVRLDGNGIISVNEGHRRLGQRTTRLLALQRLHGARPRTLYLAACNMFGPLNRF